MIMSEIAMQKNQPFKEAQRISEIYRRRENLFPPSPATRAGGSKNFELLLFDLVRKVERRFAYGDLRVPARTSVVAGDEVSRPLDK